MTANSGSDANVNKRNWAGYLAAVVAVAGSLFFLYIAAGGRFVALVQRSLLLMMALLIIFLERPLSRSRPWTRVIDALLAVSSVVICTYLVYSWRDIVFRAGAAMPWDWYLGAGLVLLVFEASRRTMGLALPILATISLAYAFWGPYVPGSLNHAGIRPETLLSIIFLTTEGIWGVAMGVAVDVIFYFILFTAFLAVTGANDIFLDLANAILGRVRGGPAKIAVVASGFFGMISGSAAANVAGTGSVTIPLMKRTGYRPEVAGAIEAVASSGGQITPPIMGAAAFIMAEVLGTSYLTVAAAAAIPALLYYVSLFFMVDLEAKRSGLLGLSKDEVPKLMPVLMRGWHVVVPLLVLMYMLLSQYSPAKSAFYSILVLLAMAIIRRESRVKPLLVLRALIDGAREMAPIAVVCAIAGIVIGVLSRTSLGQALAGFLIESSGGSLPLLLILAMLASLVLGMGLPTVAAYILLAITVAPAISKLGVPLLAAHMFVFYFGIISAITPPVAIASYTAAGIAGADLNRVSWQAIRFGLVAFLLPYMFVYGPELLLIPGGRNIAIVLAGALLGIFALAVALSGYLWGPLNWIQRAILFIGAVCLVETKLLTDVIGLVLVAVGFGWHYTMGKKSIAPTFTPN